MAKDPVCGMECDPKSSDKAEYKGQTYYFCAPGCKATFQKDPEKFLKGQAGVQHHGGMHHGGHH